MGEPVVDEETDTNVRNVPDKAFTPLIIDETVVNKVEGTVTRPLQNLQILHFLFRLNPIHSWWKNWLDIDNRNKGLLFEVFCKKKLQPTIIFAIN